MVALPPAQQIIGDSHAPRIWNANTQELENNTNTSVTAPVVRQHLHLLIFFFCLFDVNALCLAIICFALVCHLLILSKVPMFVCLFLSISIMLTAFSTPILVLILIVKVKFYLFFCLFLYLCCCSSCPATLSSHQISLIITHKQTQKCPKPHSHQKPNVQQIVTSSVEKRCFDEKSYFWPPSHVQASAANCKSKCPNLGKYSCSNS